MCFDSKTVQGVFFPRKVPGREFAPVLGATENAWGYRHGIYKYPPHRRKFCQKFCRKFYRTFCRAFYRTFCRAGFIGTVFINKKTAGLLPGGFLALETKLSFFGSLFGGFFSGCFFNNGFFCHFFNNSFFNCCFF